MKKYLPLIFILVTSIVSCKKFDDSEIWDKLNNHESRITELERICKAMNADIITLQTLITALESNDCIVSVAPLTTGDGYSLVFKSGKSVAIYNGKDGEDGTDGITPQIGVKMDIDGIYYWIVNGDWLIVDGEKVKASATNGKDGENGTDGKDGVTPQFKIENGLWLLSYDNGTTWQEAGQATGENGEDGINGDSFFAGVEKDENNVYITLKDGTVLTIPRASYDLFDHLKSLTYIPAYSDGKATVMFTNKEDSYIEMDFEVTPKHAAGAIVEKWESSLSLKAINTLTRTIGFIELPITACEADIENGTISIKASGTQLSDEFFAGTQEVSARLSISDGINDVISDYIALVAHKYANTTEHFITTDYEVRQDSNTIYLYSQNTIAGADNPIVCIDYGDGEFGTDQMHTYKKSGVYNVVFYFENPVTEITDFAFMAVAPLKNITIPNTVETIGSCAFYGGSSYNYNILLENITFENGSRLKTIKTGAFACNPAIKTLTLPSTVENIEEKAFAYCPSIEHIYAHGVYTNIIAEYGGLLEKRTNGISYIILIPANSSCEEITFGSTAYILSGGAATSIKNIKEINLTIGGIREIEGYNFLDCEKLEYVNLNATRKIGSDVFINCKSLKEVSIPVASQIGTNVICNNKSLELINFGCNDLQDINTVGNNNPKLREIYIPSGVTSIANSFNSSEAIESIHLTSIIPPKLSESFDSITSETKIYVPLDCLETYMSAEGWEEYKDNIVGHVPENTMYYYSPVELPVYSMKFTNSIKSHSYDSETGRGIIEIYNYMWEIEEGAFSGNQDIEKIYLPAHVYIESRAFYDCINLRHIYMGNTGIAEDSFDCQEERGFIPEIHVYTDPHEDVISNSNMHPKYHSWITCNNTIKIYYTTSDGLPIPDKDYCIMNEYNQSGVYVATTAVLEDFNVFSHCSTLTNAILPEGLTVITQDMFSDCNSLKSVTLPASTASIENWVFYNCHDLETIYCKAINPPTLVSDRTFPDHYTQIMVPENSVEYYENADYWLSYIREFVGYDFDNLKITDLP